MFSRASGYERQMAKIGDHLQSIQRELADIGDQAGQQASASAANQIKQLSAAISPALDGLAGLLRRSQGYAADRGAELTRSARRTGGAAVERAAAQTSEQPVLTLAVALGIGLLIGLASRRVMS